MYAYMHLLSWWQTLVVLNVQENTLQQRVFYNEIEFYSILMF